MAWYMAYWIGLLKLRASLYNYILYMQNKSYTTMKFHMQNKNLNPIIGFNT